MTIAHDQPEREIAGVDAEAVSPGGWMGLWQRNVTLLRLNGVIFILLFAFWMGMEPHWDYKYPLHVDEYFAMGYTDAMMQEGALTYENPYGDGGINNHQEMGFHLLLGTAKTATGLSWMSLYRIAPASLLLLIAFAIYGVGRREGFGWAAALFVPIIPSSIRTLGPAFLVPVAVGMLLIPVVLLILHRMQAGSAVRSLYMLGVLIAGALFIHPPTAAVLVGLVVLYLTAFGIESARAKNYVAAGVTLVGIGILTVVPLRLIARWLPGALESTVGESVISGRDTPNLMIEYLGFVTGFAEAFGVAALAVFALGVFLFSLTGPWSVRTYALPVFAAFLMVFLYVVYPQWDLGPSTLYERGWLALGMTMVLLAGYGVAWYFRAIGSMVNRIEWLIATNVKRPLLLALMGFGVACVTAVLITSLLSEEREEYPHYYHMVGEQVYRDFVWLGESTGVEGRQVVMEPSLAFAYPPLAGTGNTVTGAVASPFRSRWARQVREMLATGSVDTNWLRGEESSVVYARLPGSQAVNHMRGVDLAEIRPGVYVVVGATDAGR